MLRRILSKNLAPPVSAPGGAPAQPTAPAAVPQPAAPKPSAGQVSQPPGAVSIDNPPDHEAEKGVFDELDAMVTASKPAPKPPAAPAAPATPKPGEKPPEVKPEPPAAPPQAPPVAQTPKALRDYAKRMEDENKAYATKIADYERRIAEAEKRGKDTTDLTERLSAAEKRKDEVEQRLYALNYQEAPDFIEKFKKPLDDARDYAAEVVEGMEIVTARDEEGNPTATRKASWTEDFLPIFNASAQSTTKANQMARQLFGDDAQTVINHVQELNRLVRLRNKALTDAQKNAETERQTRVAAQTKEQEWIKDTWTKLRSDLTEKNPTIFQPDAKDTKRAEIWNKSLQTVDLVDNPNGLTPLQRMTVHAASRLRAAAYPVLQYDLNKAQERIAELETQIAEMTDGKPGNTQRPGGDGGGTPPEKSFVDELRELTD